MSKQEFDRFASNYEQVLGEHTRFSGEETGYFASYKVETVKKVLGTDGGGLRILDFGCGIGQSIPYFNGLFPKAELFGTDVSPDSITVAQQRYGALAQFSRCTEGEQLPYPDGYVDVAFTACVLHHIPHNEHLAVFREVRRVLKPGGAFFIFEHNPLNPLTMKIVNECPFDKNAVLIRAGSLKKRMAAAGFQDVRVRYCLFVPGWLRWLRPLEAALTWCPIGAQYYAEGRRETIRHKSSG